MVDAPEPVRAYVGLGSNLGDREANLRRAIEELGRHEGIVFRQMSSFLETDPVGGPPGQEKYLNAAAALDTTLTPRELLKACMEIEHSLGRTRGPDDIRWGPRTIDIDILLYGDEVIRESDLVIPHPRMHRRAFVLGPLAEIAGEARHPLANATVADLARDVPTRSEGAVSAYVHMKCDNRRLEIARTAFQAHEDITVAGTLLSGKCGENPLRCEEALLEVYTTLSLPDFLDFCSGLAEKLWPADGEARAGAVVVLLYGTERDADSGIPHPSLREDVMILRRLAHMAPYAWLSDVGKTAAEVAEDMRATGRESWHRAAMNPGRN